MYGALIGLGASLASSFIGGNKAAKERKKAENELKQQKRDNDSWWRVKSNEDATESANAQRALTKSRELLMESIRNTEGSKAVMGGTDASVAQAKQAAANAIADATSNVVVNGEARKGAAESQYLANKANLSNQQANIYNQHAADVTNASNQVMQAGMNMATADVVSHMDGGKGLFESAFGKSAPAVQGQGVSTPSTNLTNPTIVRVENQMRNTPKISKTPSIFNF